MIQKKSLKDAIQNPEIISVVGELLPVATNTQKGLMSQNMATIRITSFAQETYVKIKLGYFTNSLCALSFRRASASTCTLLSLSGILANISKLYFPISDFDIYTENSENGYIYVVNKSNLTGDLYITPLNNADDTGITAELITGTFNAEGKTKLNPQYPI